MGTAVVRVSKVKSSPAFWAVLIDGNAHALQFDGDHQRALIDFYFKDRAAFDAAVSKESATADSLCYHSPLHRQTQLFAQGLNYADHREETGASNSGDEENLIFTKASSSLCGAFDDIIKPDGCELLDYEIELGLVLKKDIDAPTSVQESELGDYIAALTICNDVSARDEQFGAPMMQWFKGKSYRTFCPTGPILYLMDEADFAQLYDLDLTLTMNGEIKQQASTAQLIHRPAKTLGEISAFASLAAGDCLLTGTPGGVQVNMSLKAGLAIMLNLKNDKKRREKFISAQKALSPYLQSGDELTLHIQSSDGSIDLGTQRSRVQIADN
jgi:2-keto-4-pentenoate hydratase/2-oxohepta-3-ene-1,7-dioic acid hydratase in catechol pathway